jgi:hypothetical protein
MEGTGRINYHKGAENTEVGIKESTKAILQLALCSKTVRLTLIS